MLNLGCWNLEYFRTAQIYFNNLLDCFDFFAISNSEHCPFKEQLGLLEASTDHKYKCIAVSASDNPPILLGNKAHGGVALFWKQTLNDFVTPLENIDSDRIVGISCDFNNSVPLFILSVYLPSSNHNIDEYDEYLDYLWALYNSLSAKGIMVAMGDFNGDLGNSLGQLNPISVVLSCLILQLISICVSQIFLSICEGPLETYFSHCERYNSTIDCIFLPNCLYRSIVSCRTFDRDIENTSDHVPVKLQIEASTDTHINTINDTNSYSEPKLKVNWSKFSQEEIEGTYITPISADLENMTIVEPDNRTNSMENLTKILLQHSHPRRC